jgi:hypothetical protein
MPIDNKTKIFYEHQNGGRCRIHSLNAYFGYCKITNILFDKYVMEYDIFLKKKFNTCISSNNFDVTSCDQTNIISYIMQCHGIHLRYYSPNMIYNTQVCDIMKNTDFIFVFNSTHIWGIRKKESKYYKVDSIGGVSIFNMVLLNKIKNLGIMVPVLMQTEYNRHITDIKDVLKKNQVSTKPDLILYLKSLHKQKKILGNLEIPLCVSISILENNISNKKNKCIYDKLLHIINKYNEFIVQFTNGNYNNINLIIKYVPDILFTLCSL